jgi:uncharacterized protein (TIGR00369 family)
MKRPSNFPGSAMMRNASPHGYGIQFVVLDDGTAHAKVVFDASKEGPPGFTHGGAVGAVLDEAMGTACFEAGRLGFTATMTVNYRASAPLDTELELHGRVDRIEGNKNFASADLKTLDGKLIADATAIFIVSERLRDLIKSRYTQVGEPFDE